MVGLTPPCSETHQICWTVEQFHAWGCSWGQNLDTPTVTTFTIWDIPPYIARFYVCKVRSHFFAVTLPCCPVDFVVNFHQKPVLGTARVIATYIPTYSSMLDPIGELGERLNHLNPSHIKKPNESLPTLMSLNIRNIQKS